MRASAAAASGSVSCSSVSVMALALGLVRVPSSRRAAMRGQPGPELPGERRGGLGGLGRAGQRARPARSAATPDQVSGRSPWSAAGRRRGLAAHDLPDHAELGGRGPGLDRRPRPQQPDQLVAVGPRAAPPRPRQLVDQQRHRPGGRRGRPASRRTRTAASRGVGAGRGRSRVRGRAAGSRDGGSGSRSRPAPSPSSCPGCPSIVIPVRC